jgi:glucose/arabinose dehydrogenase
MTRRLGAPALASAVLGLLPLGLAAPPAKAQQADIGIAAVTLGAGPYLFDTAEQHRIRVDVVVRGLPHPFSLAFLPDGDALISERGGNLRLVRHATGAGGAQPMLEAAPVTGAPEPGAFRGAGLHEIAAAPDFATSRLVYFTYNRPAAESSSSAPAGTPAGTGAAPARPRAAIALARARLEGLRLVDREELFAGEEQPGTSGSRLAFGPGGMLFMTTGAPFDGSAQRLDSVYGKVLRLGMDGSIPKDNPFVGRAGARPEIYSLGHRDQLGLAVEPRTGAVLAAEHGPNGGDEINLILPGRNYGWPEYSFGRDYQGPRISKVPLGPDTEQPLILWIPSIAPTGLAFYTGDRFPAWQGNLFVGSARRGEIPRTGGLERVVVNDRLEELRRERLLTDLHQRIRDVRQGPDGLLYVVTDEDDGALLRISPAE